MFLFCLQSMVPTDALGTSEEEMGRLKEELEMWKASSVKHMESWRLAEREGLVHPSKTRSTPPHL